MPAHENKRNKGIRQDVEGVMRWILGMMAMVLLAACSEEPENWTAFVYPDRQNVPIGSEIQRYAIGRFESFKDCRAAAATKMEEIFHSDGPVPAYECGYACGERAEYGGMFVCQTVKR